MARRKVKGYPNTSYVFSVSVGKGCYRHIRISANDSFYELADAILNAFDFDFDHLCAFYMDNRPYSRDSYELEAEPGMRDMRDHLLGSAGLKKDQKFLFLFDFGDEWEFSCKVLKVLEEPTDEPEIIRSVGESPDQYPDYDDEDYDDDDYYDDDDDEDDDDYYDDDEDDDGIDYYAMLTRGINKSGNVIDISGRMDTIKANDPDLDFDEEDDEDEDEFQPDYRDPGPDYQHYITDPHTDIEDELYEAAFAYKKTKLWKKLYDSDMFAVELDGGEIGYVGIMGMLGDHIALALYPNKDALYSVVIMRGSSDSRLDPRTMSNIMLAQDNIQCQFVGKFEIPFTASADVREYARKNNIKLSGKNAYPHFERFTPERMPWAVIDPEDRKHLLKALRAAVYVSETIKKDSKLLDALRDYMGENMPLIKEENGSFTWQTTPRPQEVMVEYPNPDYEQKFKRIKREGAWECELIFMPAPTSKDKNGIPYYPCFLIAVDERGMVINFGTFLGYEENVNNILDDLMDTIRDRKCCPIAIKVIDNRTYDLLESFCKTNRIRLQKMPHSSALDEIYQMLSDSFFGEKDDDLEDEMPVEMVETFLEVLRDAPVEQLKQMPHEVLKRLLDFDIVPDELKEKISRALLTIE